MRWLLLREPCCGAALAAGTDSEGVGDEIDVLLSQHQGLMPLSLHIVAPLHGSIFTSGAI